MDIAIQRTLNTIERTGSQAAQDRLKERETEKGQVKSKIERLVLELTAAQVEITPKAIDIILAAWRDQFQNLQESGNVRDVKAWLMQFVSKIELGYNKARIFYTYPMIDLFQSGSDNSRNISPFRGGTQHQTRHWACFCFNLKRGRYISGRLSYIITGLFL